MEQNQFLLFAFRIPPDPGIRWFKRQPPQAMPSCPGKASWHLSRDALPEGWQ